MPLSDLAIRSATTREKAYKIFDGGGLHIVVSPSGSKLWRLKYRFEGREKLLSFGPYPLVSLKRAREKRDEAKLCLLDGQDPGELKKTTAIAAAVERSVTFGGIAEEYLEKLKKEGRAPQTMKKLTWLIGFTDPTLTNRPISQLTSPEILSLLRSVESKGTYETAGRLRSTIGAVFRYGIATGRAESDPTEALKGALIRPQVKSRAALIDRNALGGLLLSMDSTSGQITTRCALQLLALIAPRPGELRQARWKEFELEAAVWRVPAERMKMRREHRVPLAPQAVEILRDLHAFSGSSSFAFPSSRSWKKPISENTLNAALRRLGYSADQVSAHGFRATFSTLANESGLWNADAIERALAHVEGNDVRRAYLRGEHWEERVRMARWWADELDAMRREAQRDD